MTFCLNNVPVMTFSRLNPLYLCIFRLIRADYRVFTWRRDLCVLFKSKFCKQYKQFVNIE